MMKSHYTYCVIGIVVAGALFLAFGMSASTLGVFALALACPVMMIAMMRSMAGSSTRHDAPEHDPAGPRS
jgi:hypothetical protein